MPEVLEIMRGRGTENQMEANVSLGTRAVQNTEAATKSADLQGAKQGDAVRFVDLVNLVQVSAYISCRDKADNHRFSADLRRQQL